MNLKMIIHWNYVKNKSKFLLIFLVSIVIKSISISATSDLNLNDYNYGDQYESHPSIGTSTLSGRQQTYQWFYNSDRNSNQMSLGSEEMPSALTQIDRFFNTGRFIDSTGISGHFPFDNHQE